MERANEWACKPDSVHRHWRLDDHSSGPAVARRIKLPTRTCWGKAALWVRFYVGRSVALDRETLHLHRWGARERAAFLASKAAALPALQAGRTATVRAGDVHFRATSPLDLGTFQTCLLDVHDVVVVPAVLDGTPAPVVVDVGANVGQFAAATRAFVPDAQIVSVEPDPDTHAKLRHNLAGFPGARSHQVAVGEERAVMTLHRHHVSVMATLRPGEVEDYDPELTVDVDVLTLDEITADLPRIVAVTHPDNAPSQRVARRLGMRDEGLTDRYYDTTTRLFVLER